MPLTRYFNLNGWQKFVFCFFFLTQHSSFSFTSPFIKQVTIINVMLKWDQNIENRITCSQQLFTESIQHALSAEQMSLSETGFQICMCFKFHCTLSYKFYGKLISQGKMLGWRRIINDWEENSLFNLYWGLIDKCSLMSSRYVQSFVKPFFICLDISISNIQYIPVTLLIFKNSVGFKSSSVHWQEIRDIGHYNKIKHFTVYSKKNEATWLSW